MLDSFRTCSVLAALALTALAPSPAGADADTTFSNGLKPGATLHVLTIAGSVHVMHADGAAIAHGRAHASDGGPIDMHLAQSHAGADWTLCEVPLDRHDCSDGARPALDVDRHEHATVDVTVTVPAGVKIDVSTVSGDADVSGATATVDVATVSGAQRVVATGNVRLKTVSGTAFASTPASVSAQSVSGNVDARSGATADASFHSVSGSLKLAINRAASVRIDAKTLSGAITGGGYVNFTTSGGFMDREAQAKRGSGDHAITLQTVSGPIAVTTY